jgi:hypothetical protein
VKATVRRLKRRAQEVTHVLPGDTVVLSGPIHFLGRDELEGILHLDGERREVKRSSCVERPPSTLQPDQQVSSVE